MARRAIKDTFAFEQVGLAPGDDTEVRRQVIAGQPIPDHYRVEDSDAFVEEEGAPVVGLGAAPHAYKHQVGSDGQLLEEHGGPAKGKGKSSSSKAASGGSEE